MALHSPDPYVDHSLSTHTRSQMRLSRTTSNVTANLLSLILLAGCEAEDSRWTRDLTEQFRDKIGGRRWVATQPLWGGPMGLQRVGQDTLVDLRIGNKTALVWAPGQNFRTHGSFRIKEGISSPLVTEDNDTLYNDDGTITADTFSILVIYSQSEPDSILFEAGIVLNGSTLELSPYEPVLFKTEEGYIDSKWLRVAEPITGEP